MICPTSDQWILVPGTLCTPAVFSPMLEHLGIGPERRQFVDVDKPNVHDYAASLRSVVKGGEIVCGFSLGAMILAHNLGALEKAKAVVLLACNPFSDASGNRANREAARDRILSGEVDAWFRENWHLMSNDPSDALRDFVGSMATATAQHIPAQTELAASRPGAAEALSATGLPIVFVTGSADQLTPPGALHDIVEAADRASLRILDGLGHFALIEAPDRVAGSILQGLSEVVRKTRAKT